MKRWWFLFAALLLTAVFAILLFRMQPSREDRVRSIRESSQTYLVITRDIFADALRPWQERRESEGFQVIVGAFKTPPTPVQVKQWISLQTRKAGDACRYILLVGDCGAAAESDEPWHLPSNTGDMGFKYEEEEAHPIISDVPYGDLDSDGFAEVAVGRLPVRTPAQLENQLRKIFQYEERVPDPSYYRVVLWTGAKSYHQPMHGLTLQFASDMLPDWLYPWILSGYPESVCSGPLARQPELFLQALSQPAFLTLVVSHGSYNNLRCVEKQGQEIPLTVDALAGLSSASAGGPMILLACEAGSYYLPSEKGPSIAEAFLDHPGGPVAVIASSGMINVAANFFMATAIAGQIRDKDPSIGDLLVDSRALLYRIGKYSLNQIGSKDARVRRLTGAINNPALMEQKGLIRSERLNYNLLGDPSLKLRKPQPMGVHVRQSRDSALLVSGQTPQGARTLWVERIDPDRRRWYLPEQSTDEERQRLFDQANRPPELVARIDLNADTWQFEWEEQAGADAAGRKIRIMAADGASVYYHTLALPLSESMSESMSLPSDAQ